MSQEVTRVKVTLDLFILLIVLLCGVRIHLVCLLELLKILAHVRVLEKLLRFGSFIGVCIFYLPHHKSFLGALRLIDQMLFVLSE